MFYRGLAQLHFSWQYIPRSCREKIFQQIVDFQSQSRLSPACICSILFGVGEMHVLLDRAPVKLREAIFKSVINALDTDKLVSANEVSARPKVSSSG